MKKVFIVTAVIAVFVGVPCLAPAAIRGTCQGGLNDGQPCGSDADCTGGDLYVARNCMYQYKLSVNIMGGAQYGI